MFEDSQLTFADDSTNLSYKESLSLILKGDFSQSLDILNKLLEQDISFPDIYSIMKCLKFWLNREDLIHSLEEGIEKAEYLKQEWKEFDDFIADNNIQINNIYDRFKNNIFSAIIDNYIFHFQNLDVSDTKLLLSISECFLKIQDYEKAKNTLLYAFKFGKNAVVLALLGEAHYWLNEKIKALGYLREAFFINPEKIDLDLLQNECILELKLEVSENGFQGKEINYWLPIYAEINKKFTIKKKLTNNEFHSLEREIYQLERQGEISKKNSNIIEPILINHYIFLLDHYLLSRADFEQDIKNVLRKIKNINHGVYQKLRNHYE